MRKVACIIPLSLILWVVPACAAMDMWAGNVHIFWNSDEDLEEFNDNVYFSSSFSLFGGSSNLTVREQVRNKVVRIFGRVQEILHMAIPKVRVNMQILHSADQVQQIYRTQYGKEVEFIAFYSPKTNTVYVAANEAKLRVVAHEFGHSVIEHFFTPSPPINIHELMAQYVEKYIDE